MVLCKDFVLLLLVLILSIFSKISEQKKHSKNIKNLPSRLGFRGWLLTRNPDYIQFLLYPDPENEDYFEEIKLGDTKSLERSGFDRSKPVILLVHGILGGFRILTDVQLVKNAYLSIGENSNIIFVDYRELAGAHFPLYLSLLNGALSLPANFNVGIVAKRVAAFISFLKMSESIRDMNDIHIVGHSLGCHIAGRTGEIIYERTNEKIRRISGLDCPGGQIFPYLLEKSDASFVDVTHTSFGLGGVLGNIGHADFYINGGSFSQPNCLNAIPVTDPYCTHSSSVFYFAKSIRNKNIFGCKCEFCWRKPTNCDEVVRYGHFANDTLHGSFYIELPTRHKKGKRKSI